MNRSAVRTTARASLTLAMTLALAFMLLAATTAHAARAAGKPKPTIVLVHGAWANSGSWNGVIKRLQAQRYTVDAPPNPLTSLNGDAATIAEFLKTIKGPIVLVGHSYGGAVITNAARGNTNVKALVYVDAFAPAKGESAFGLTGKFPGSVLTAAPPANVFTQSTLPGADTSDPLLYVKPAVFAKGFANDLTAKQGAIAAATQAPVAMAAVTAPSGDPAWTSIASWYVLGTVDKVIPPATQLFMAQRAHAHITKVPAGHLVMVSHPNAVTKVIVNSARATG